ncbi:hypothetical protein EYF80_011850 [Liparis tanakae]|uniref:Uncharacterized protein n=1 Tax=Liparis tanakae TaxID=230148 RepID=A0A4Z2IJF5_9TELE|nr:hypothetical protein EYF80_011850 [Liparis tanakae]
MEPSADVFGCGHAADWQGGIDELSRKPSQTEVSTNRLRAVPKVSMLLSAMPRTCGGTELSQPSTVAGNEQRETHREKPARQRGMRQQINKEEDEKNCQTKERLKLA